MTDPSAPSDQLANSDPSLRGDHRAPATADHAPARGGPEVPAWTAAQAAAHHARRKRDRVLGMSIILGAFIAGLALSYWAKLASRPETSEPPGPPTTKGIEGFPTRVEVAKTLALARTMTKRNQLRGFVAEGVRSDGTIDLSEGPGQARYAFQSEAGHGPQPPREPGTLPRREYCGRQDIHLRREGLVAQEDRTETPCLGRSVEPLPDPQCSLAAIWKKALERGLPSDRLARIEYFRARGGPAWRFELPTGEGGFVLYGDCQRELKGHDSQGRVP